MGATFTVGAFSFDSFRDSLPIVSLERCVDVMGVVTNPNQQPQTNASLANAVFFVIITCLAASSFSCSLSGGPLRSPSSHSIFALTASFFLFNIVSSLGISGKKVGSAWLMQQQREWIDLEKLLRR